MLWHEATAYGTSPGWGGAAGGTGWQPGLPEPSDSFIFGLPFPAFNANVGSDLSSLWTVSLKRSARSAWSISLAVSCDVEGGVRAITSKRSVSSQAGPPSTLAASTL